VVVSIQRATVIVLAAVRFRVAGVNATNGITQLDEYHNELLAAVGDFVRDVPATGACDQTTMARVTLSLQLVNATLAAGPSGVTLSGVLHLTASAATPQVVGAQVGGCMASQLVALSSPAVPEILTVSLQRASSLATVLSVEVQEPTTMAAVCSRANVSDAQQLATLLWSVRSEGQRSELMPAVTLSDGFEV